MPILQPRTLWSFAAAAAALLGAFWLTLWLTEKSSPWPRAHPHNASVEVVEATYGMNCAAYKPSNGVNQVKTGNATRTIAQVCERALETCDFYADLGQMQDPAPGCDKDLQVSWRCGNAEKIRSVRAAARADGKFVSRRCP